MIKKFNEIDNINESWDANIVFERGQKMLQLINEEDGSNIIFNLEDKDNIDYLLYCLTEGKSQINDLRRQ
jgi:hypothetical protein